MKVILNGTIFKKNGEEAAVKLSYTGDNKAVARFTVSEPRKFGRTEQNKLDFWDFTVFGKQAEFLEKNFKAGKPISIIGDAYHSRDDKNKTYLNLIASEVDFLPKEYGEFEAEVMPPENQEQPQTKQPQVSNQQVAPQQTQTAPQQVYQQPAQQNVAKPVQNAAPGFAPPEDYDPFA